jgi:hypothetical protein
MNVSAAHLALTLATIKRLANIAQLIIAKNVQVLDVHSATKNSYLYNRDYILNALIAQRLTVLVALVRIHALVVLKGTICLPNRVNLA